MFKCSHDLRKAMENDYTDISPSSVDIDLNKWLTDVGEYLINEAVSLNAEIQQKHHVPCYSFNGIQIEGEEWHYAGDGTYRDLEKSAEWIEEIPLEKITLLRYYSVGLVDDANFIKRGNLFIPCIIKDDFNRIFYFENHLPLSVEEQFSRNLFPFVLTMGNLEMFPSFLDEYNNYLDKEFRNKWHDYLTQCEQDNAPLFSILNASKET